MSGWGVWGGGLGTVGCVRGVWGRVGACWVGAVPGWCCCWRWVGALGLSGARALVVEVCLSLPRRWGVKSNLSFGFFGVVESGLSVVVEPGLAGLL